MLSEGAAEMIMFAMEQIKLDADRSSSKKKRWKDITKLKSARLSSWRCLVYLHWSQRFWRAE